MTKARIVEVGPRDGLQNENQDISIDDKVALIEMLADSGLSTIEAGAFVSPKWVPQMAGTSEVLSRISRRDGVSYPVLVPNVKGVELAVASGVTEIAIFTAASEGFSRKNINCSIAESFERFANVVEIARQHDIRVRGYVSCVVDCPYDGAIAPAQVADVAEKLLKLGCYEVSLGDTIGTATPNRIRDMVRAVSCVVPVAQLAGHYHDTYGQALANILVSLEAGVRVFDCSVAGLGGCPYAKGASGNVATEDVVYMLDGLGFETGVDLEKLARAGDFISKRLGRRNNSKTGVALLAKDGDAGDGWDVPS